MYNTNTSNARAPLGPPAAHRGPKAAENKAGYFGWSKSFGMCWF